MHAYGHSRRDKLECRYGCCTGKSGKHCTGRRLVDRANRKTARQDARLAVVTDTQLHTAGDQDNG